MGDGAIGIGQLVIGADFSGPDTLWHKILQDGWRKRADRPREVGDRQKEFDPY
jgi:hypothetical protein